MSIDYNLELNRIVENIYKEMIYNIVIKTPDLDLSVDNIDKIKKLLCSNKVYLGNDMDDFIISSVPLGLEGDLFRCSIAQHHNRLHPRFLDYKGNRVKDSSYNNFALLLWEEHMNKLLIEDIQQRFSYDEFFNFINCKLLNNFNDLVNRVNEYKLKTIIINFDKKEFLLNVVKNMISKNELDFDYAYMLVDIDKLRSHMVEMAASFDIYNEFDKLEDDTRYCLDNFPKYNAFELYDFLVNEQGFKLKSEGILVKQINS